MWLAYGSRSQRSKHLSLFRGRAFIVSRQMLQSGPGADYGGAKSHVLRPCVARVGA